MPEFKDKYGRVIGSGDIGAFIANGHRAGGHGGISVGIIDALTEHSIRARTILEGRVKNAEGRFETVYYWGKTNFFVPENCYIIRGITLEQFTDGITVLSAEEYKKLLAEEDARRAASMAAWIAEGGKA